MPKCPVFAGLVTYFISCCTDLPLWIVDGDSQLLVEFIKFDIGELSIQLLYGFC